MNTSAVRRLYAPFQKLTGRLLAPFDQWGWDNGFTQRANTAAGTDSIDLIGTDPFGNDKLTIGGAYQNPLGHPVVCAISANGKISQNTPILVNSNVGPREITRIDCIYGTANGAAMTANVTKEVAGQAPGAGSSCMTGTFNLNTTTNTLQTATLAGVRGYPSLVLNAGEQLSLHLSTTVTSLAALTIVVWMRPALSLPPATLALEANGDIATMGFYLNAIPNNKIKAIAMRWSTAGTDSGAVTADITKDASGTAPGGGTSVLSAAQSLKGTANTTVFPALAASAATLTLASTDLLSFKLTGTPTALAGLIITVFFETSTEDLIVVSQPLWDALSTDRTVFIANTWYEFYDFMAVWSTASSSGTYTITKDTGTTAPGGGTALLTGTISTAATANTPLEGAVVVTAKKTIILAPGDRLAIKNGGSPTSGVGSVVTAALKKL